MDQLAITLFLVSMTIEINLGVFVVDSQAANQSIEVMLLWNMQIQHNDIGKDYRYKGRELTDQQTMTVDDKKIVQGAVSEQEKTKNTQQVKKKTALMKKLSAALSSCRKYRTAPNLSESQSPVRAKSSKEVQPANKPHDRSRKLRCGHCKCCKQIMKNYSSRISSKGFSEPYSMPLRPPKPPGMSPGGSNSLDFHRRDGHGYPRPGAGTDIPEARAGKRPGRFGSSFTSFRGIKRFSLGAGAGAGAGAGTGIFAHGNPPPHLMHHGHHRHHGIGGGGGGGEDSGSEDSGDCSNCCSCEDCGLSSCVSEMCDPSNCPDPSSCCSCLEDEEVALMICCFPCFLLGALADSR